ncbi:MAG: hypothetical protein SFY56_07380 [Bacteroidota bacterium]|nr:hypothetical protein [Bacteroidota bacterium]
MRKTIFFFLLLVLFSHTFAQTDSIKLKNSYHYKTKKFYMSWGYTRAIYSKSTIQFKDYSNKYHDVTGRNNYYDFKVYNVTASDRPDFNQIKDLVNVTIPQFVARIGYQINEKWGIEMNYDHTKYIVDDYQKVRVAGQINNNWFDNDTILDPTTFLHFEHSDGANFWMLNAVRKFNLYKPHRNFCASWVVKPGAGVVVPRTDVTLFGERLNNNWKVAGVIVGVESGLRLEFLNHGFFEFVGKSSFANYVNTFVLGAGNGIAHHYFFCGQLTSTIGIRF